MYTPGKLLYFDPFYFKIGNPKPKYFIVLHNDHNSAIVASLPTSKDYVPSNIALTPGCIEKAEINFNCYHFPAGIVITTNDLSFPESTFVYGSQIDSYDLKILEETYQVEGAEYEIVGTLKKDELKNLIECLANSASVKNKFRRILKEGLKN